MDPGSRFEMLQTSLTPGGVVHDRNTTTEKKIDTQKVSIGKGRGGGASIARGPQRAMRQLKLGSHTPPCHKRMVVTTLFSVLLAALQRRPALYHTRWLLAVHWYCGSGH